MDASIDRLLETLRQNRDLRRRSEDNVITLLGQAREILEVTLQACKHTIPTIGYADEMLKVLIADARRVTAAEIDFAETVNGREAMDALITAIEASEP